MVELVHQKYLIMIIHHILNNDHHKLIINVFVHQKITGDHCQKLHYPSYYCINNGNITDTFDINNEPIKICSCPQGFQGEHCENNIDDCINIHCSHHGSCQDDLIHTNVFVLMDFMEIIVNKKMLKLFYYKLQVNHLLL